MKSLHYTFLSTLFVLLALSALLAVQGSQVIELTDSNFHEHISDKNVWVVEFYAKWCGSCKQFKPMLESVAKDIALTKPEVRIGNIDVDKNPSLALKFFISRLPSVFVIKESEIRVWEAPLEKLELLDILESEKWRGWKIWSGLLSPFSFIGSFFGFIGTINRTFNYYTRGIPPYVLVITISAIVAAAYYYIHTLPAPKEEPLKHKRQAQTNPVPKHRRKA
ncbi:hypothetical protein K7432_017100 [Basidiobolus ranarum]|uniref:Thioredoxin domain-containing protein n=1 Tax=Basidiobolus ranarum TaxID=34480 RepID=A0ABR2VKS5_9FUNG